MVAGRRRAVRSHSDEPSVREVPGHRPRAPRLHVPKARRTHGGHREPAFPDMVETETIHPPQPTTDPAHFGIDEGLAAQNEPCQDLGMPPIAGAADVEYETRLDAQRVTAEFGTKSQRRFDSGSKP